MNTIKIFFHSILLICNLSAQIVWHVAPEGSDDSGTGSFEFPFATIQHGLEQSIPGDTVLVQPGIYPEHLNFQGYGTVVTSRFYQNQDSLMLVSTVIDGQGMGSVVTFNSGESGNAQLLGFTIRNGSGTFDDGFKGGGIYCVNNSHPQLKNLIIAHNHVPATIDFPSRGGGLYLRDSYADLVSVIVRHNSASQGAGLAADDCHLDVYNSELSQNSALNDFGWPSRGGAVHTLRAFDDYFRITASENQADEGGAFYIEDARVRFYNSNIWGNSINEMTAREVDSMTVISTHYINLPVGEQWLDWGTANVSHLHGVLNADPMFVDQDNGDFHLLPGSPCIDAGNPYNQDLDCTFADLGAYPYYQGACPDYDIRLDFGVLDTVNQTLEILTHHIEPIGGYQIWFDGIEISYAYGGLTQSAGFMMSANDSVLLAFGMMTIAPGEGVLAYMNYTSLDDQICFDDAMISNGSGEGHTVELGPCISPYSCTMLGDLNFDEFLDVLDIVDLVSCILADHQCFCADMNDDQALNVIDVVILVEIIMGEEVGN